MSKLFRTLKVALISLISLTMFSCGGGDDEPDNNLSPETTLPGDNTPAVTSPFVGLWYGNILGGLVFFDNGTFWVPGKQIKGYWNFNNSTNLLSTDYDGNMWEVSLLTPESWTGVNLKTSKSQSFIRETSDKEILSKFLVYGTFKNDKYTFRYNDSIGSYQIIYPGGYYGSETYRYQLVQSDKEEWEYALKHYSDYIGAYINFRNIYGGFGKTQIEIALVSYQGKLEIIGPLTLQER